jgi:hypothetical protein
MLKWMFAVALGAAVAAPAMAQDVKTKLADRPMKKVKDYDQEPIKEGIKATGQSGLCTASFVVAHTGKAKNINVDCPSPDFVPYVVRAVESAEWEAEVVGGYFFDNPLKQQFKFGTNVVADPRGEKGPSLVNGIQQRDIDKAMDTVKAAGSCDMKYTVGVDGVPKDIVPGCTPAAYDLLMIEAVKKMKFQPGQKGGQPTEWPGLTSSLKLTKPDN